LTFFLLAADSDGTRTAAAKIKISSFFIAYLRLCLGLDWLSISSFSGAEISEPLFFIA
jgi:hypothetical protein